jgi:hypothetical protein
LQFRQLILRKRAGQEPKREKGQKKIKAREDVPHALQIEPEANTGWPCYWLDWGQLIRAQSQGEIRLLIETARVFDFWQ